MYKVIASRMIVPNVHVLTVEAPDVVRDMQPGQFVIIRAEEEGERIPLSVSDWDADRGTVTLVFLNIGSTTHRLARLEEGSGIPTVVGPLGNAAEIGEFGTVLRLAGHMASAASSPSPGRSRRGNRIITVLERAALSFY